MCWLIRASFLSVDLRTLAICKFSVDISHAVTRVNRAQSSKLTFNDSINVKKTSIFEPDCA